MKDLFIKYYAIIIVSLFLIINLFLCNIKVGGILYQYYMIILIIINGLLLFIFRKKIKFKILTIIIFFFTWLFSNNIYQLFFAISSIIFLCIAGFMESNIIKVLSVLITLFFSVISMPLLFILVMFYQDDFSNTFTMNDVYDDMHYYCDNNYEVYSYSAGAMDSFHFSIGKYYDFINIDGIIYVIYRERKEVSYDKYTNFLKNNNCNLVGEDDGD